MRLAIFSKADIIGAYNLNRLLKQVHPYAQAITVFLSDKIFYNERGFPFADNLGLYERDYPLEYLFPLIDKYSDRAKQDLYTFNQLKEIYGCTITLSKNSLSPRQIKGLYEFRPDILLASRYDFIFSAEQLDLAVLAALNTHPGHLPLYRGLCAPFWAMLEKKTQACCTVHHMVPRVDCGDIVERCFWPIDYGHSLLWNTLQIYRQGVDALGQIIRSVSSGKEIGATAQENQEARYFTAPDEDTFLCLAAQGTSIVEKNEYRGLIAPFLLGLPQDALQQALRQCIPSPSVNENNKRAIA